MANASVSVVVVSQDARAYQLGVRVREGGSETTHEVTLGRDLFSRLAPGATPQDFVERCFAFLLEREAKESILQRFDVSVIGRYFPEFEKTIADSTST